MNKNKQIKVICVVGARPNFIKIAPLLKEFKKYPKFNPVLVHTGQHYDKEMSDVFFEDLNILKPDYNLKVKAGLHGRQTGYTMIEFEKVCLKERPSLVIVFGDVNSTLAASLVAKKLHIIVAHIESGLRSGNLYMPEEINRILTDHVSDYLFTTCIEANKNLIKEGIPKEKIHFVGDIMVDTLLQNKNKILNRSILSKLKLNRKQYALLTLHRSSNVDDPEKLKKLLDIFQCAQKKIKIVFLIHPRTKKMIKDFGLESQIKKKKNFNIVPPVSYLDMLCLINSSRLVLSDSGGIQQETTTFNIPCLTLREETERPITVEQGTNILVGTNKKRILNEVSRILEGKNKFKNQPEKWDGKTAKRILQILKLRK
jgi:UDP-N-acetylglucosamine 2-epimerase (non-hydrolysing)